MRDDQVTGGAVVLLTANRPARIVTAGVVDLQTRAPVTRHTLFEIGSLSKTVTAFALLQMREEGLVELDRPIDAYLSWFHGVVLDSPRAASNTRVNGSHTWATIDRRPRGTTTSG